MSANAIAILPDRSVDLVLIGGSAGVLDVLRVVLCGLERVPTVPVVIVVHLPERSATLLPQVFQYLPNRSVKFAEDKEPLAAGGIYFAPPGYHLLLESHRCFALSADPPVLFSRPSIDVLFESAAQTDPRHTLGILLTGASADGAAGLQAIHVAGGITVVQTPQSAEANVMPSAALARFEPSYVLAPAEIATLLASLSAKDGSHVTSNNE